MRFVCLSVFLAACAHAPKEAAVTAPWTQIDLADGSANAYHFTPVGSGRVQFLYVPVTKEQSSTGMYDGGPPRTEVLDANDARLAELFALLRKLEADQANRSADRNKGTGAIAWDDAEGKHSFIVQMGVADLNALMELLTRFGS